MIDVGDVNETYGTLLYNTQYGACIYTGGIDNAENPRGGTFMISVEANERISKWSSYEEIYAAGHFKWAYSLVRSKVGAVNAAEKSVTLSDALHQGISIGAPFYFVNVYEEMDMPGEYYIDKETGYLYIYKTENFDADY